MCDETGVIQADIAKISSHPTSKRRSKGLTSQFGNCLNFSFQTFFRYLNLLNRIKIKTPEIEE